MEIEIIDKWKAILPQHTTEYIMFNDGHDYDIVISRATHENGQITYCMSNSDNPMSFYGNEKEIARLFKEINHE